MRKHCNCCNTRVTLVPLSFHIFVSDMFLILDHTYFASYADDDTHHNINQITDSMKELSIPILSWFKKKN